MTASLALPSSARRSSAPGPAATAGIIVIAGLAILILSLAGLTFVGLAIAFPIAVPAAQQLHVAVSASDIAIAQRLADFAWVFGGLGLASFVGAAIIAFKTIVVLSPPAAD